MPIVNVKDFGVVRFPDEMSPDDIKSALDKKYAKPSPLTGALAGVEEFAGSLPKGLASISEGATPVDVPAPIWNGEIPNGAPMTMDSGGRVAVVPPQTGPSVRPRTGSEVIDALKQNKLYQIGQTAAESVPLTAQQEASKWTQGGKLVGGSVGMALGPLATPAFAVSSMGNTAEDFDRIKQENPKLSEDEAADQALQMSVNKGIITAATFSVLPPALRGALEKHLVGKLGNRWVAGRLASATEAGTVMGAQTAGQNIAEGKKPTEGLGASTGGGAIMGLLLPWLKKQPMTAGVRAKADKLTKLAGEGETDTAAALPDQSQTAGKSQAETLLKEDEPAPAPKSKAVPYKLESDEGGGYSITAPDGSVVSTHGNYQEAKLAMDKLKVTGGRVQPADIKLTVDEAKAQGPDAVKAIMAKHGVDRDTAVAIQSANRTRLGITKDLAGAPEPAKPSASSQPDPNWQVTVQSDEIHPETGVKIPSGYVQIDDISGGKNNWSKSPQTLAKEGVTVHDFSKLPQGKYTYEQAVSKLNEMSMPAEDRAHIEAERGTVDVPVEVVDATDGNNPFAKRLQANIATIDRASGKILINKDAFSEWLKGIPVKARAMAVRSLLGEERIHLATDDAAAAAYWDNLTAQEKAIVRRRYAGKGSVLRGMNRTLWGHEALRFRMQQLARMTPREIADAVGSEKWTLKGLTLIETAIRGIREKFLRTGASKESLHILNKIQDNLNMGKVVAAGGSPKAMSKQAQKLAFNQADELEKDALLFERSGDKAGADEMRDMAKDLRQRTFDQSFQDEKTPGARRRSYPEDHAEKIEDSIRVQMPKQLQDTLTEIFGRQAERPGDREMGWEPDLKQALEYFAQTPTTKWDLSGKNKAALIKFFNNAKGTPAGRAEILDYNIHFGEEQLRGHSESDEYSDENMEIYRDQGMTDGEIEAAKNKRDQEMQWVADWLKELHQARSEVTGEKREYFPGARIKKKPESVFQDKFLLPESESQKVMGSGNQKVVKPGGEELPPVPEGERKTAVESGAKEYPTVQEALASGEKWLDEKVQEAVAGADMGKHAKISEKEFAAAIRAQNPNIQPGQLSEMWTDSIYKKLANATDEEIRALTMNVLVPKAGSLQEAEAAPGELGGIKGGGRSEGRSGSIWAAMANKMLSFSKGAAEKPAQGVLFPGIDRPGGYKEKKFSERYKQPTVAPIDPKTGKPGIKPRDLNAEAADRQNIRDEKEATKRRTVLISALYKKLAVPATEKADIHRSDVTIDDIRYGGGKLINAVQDYSRADDIPIDRLTSELLDDSKRRSDDPTTYTKRLTLIEDRLRGKVSLVSTYRRGEDAMLMDPLHPQNHHMPLPDMLRRYRVIGSILLDHPIQKFKKTWDTLGEYNNEFGKEAHQINDAHTSGTGQVETQTHYIGGRRHTQIAGENEGVPGTEVEEGASGHLQGPFRGEIEAATGAGRGSADKSRAVPISRSEGDALEQHIVESLGRVPDSPSDVRRVLDEMTVVKPKPAAMSALIKLAGEIEHESGSSLTTEGMLNKLAENIYEDPDSQKAVARQYKAAFTRNRETVASTLPERAKQTGRELVNPIARRAPTDVRPENLPPGTPQPSFTHSPPVPQATTKPRTREILSDNDQKHVEAMSKDPRFASAPEIRQGKERLQAAEERRNTPMQRGNLLREKSPMAVNRKRLQEERDRAIGELATAKTRAADAFNRRDTAKAMSASLDAADTVANNFAENAQWSIRMPSSDDARNVFGMKKSFHGKKEILEGAPAMLAAGSVKARYHYGPEAMAEAERLMKDEAYSKKESYLAHLKKDLAIKTNMGKDTPAMREAVKSMQNEFDTMIQKKLLETGFLNQADATYYHDPEAKSKIDEYMFRVKQGMEAADRMIKDGNYWDKYRGRRWKRGNEKLLETLEFAKAQWDNPELQDTAMWMRKELDRQFELERNNGYSVQYDDNYMPGRYDGELFSQHGVLFAGTRILGRQFRAAKVFPTFYHAAQVGPYVPASLDGSAMVGSRVRQGMRSVMKNTWWNGLKHINDDVTGQPIAKRGKEVGGKISAPGTDYTHEFKTPGGDKIYILDGYENLVHQLTDPDAITKNVMTRGMLEAGQFLKHTVLLGDVFHLGRVTYYAASILGRKTGYLPGWAATSIREEDIPRAIKAGTISQKTADFLTEKVAFRIGAKASMISRARLSHLYQRSGLNVGRIQDAIYKDLVRHIPGFSQYNRFLFDRYTRGMMMTSALREFDRLSKLDPQKDSRDIVQESARDLNFYFGSIGRQGWIKSQTFQSLASMTFLAPQWLEGLVRKELAPIRGVLNPKRAFTGRDTMFRGIARGMLSMLALTQVASMITKGHPTWQNKEKDHKWDVEVADNVWLSPLSVFNELTGDMIRMLETKPKAWDAIQQIGENKLGFYGRAAMVLATGKAPGGQYKTTTAGVLGQAAKQLIPTPISFGVGAQWAGNKIAPGLIPPVPKQIMAQKLYSTTGLKTHAGMDAEQYTKLSAEKFRKDNNITTPKIEYTDEPNYSQLRYLVKNGDLAGATKMLAELKKTKTDKDIIDAMRIWVRKPFTGSLHSERLWLGGMSDDERATYDDAVTQKMKEYEAFVDWYFHTPQ